MAGRLGDVGMDGELPRRADVPVVFDELDYQLGCQAYLWSLPLVSAPRLPLLLAALASLPVDHLARCRHAGANLNFFKLEQVPVPPPSAYDVPAPWDPSTTIETWNSG